MRKVMFYLVLSLSCLALSAQKVTRDSSLCARRTAEIVAEKLQTQLALFPQSFTCIWTNRCMHRASRSGSEPIWWMPLRIGQ